MTRPPPKVAKPRPPKPKPHRKSSVVTEVHADHSEPWTAAREDFYRRMDVQ